MLPQVANHILHHTTRAVAAAQNQAGHTLRNVLGLQSAGTPSSSTSLGPWNGAGSSSWGSGHAGAGGGAKYHTGSRFYSGYTGPGRAVTQANTSTSNDAGTSQTDDNDDPRPRPTLVRSTRKPRSRRHSFSLGSDAHAQSERAESFGVLKAVQQHARSRHAFAEPSRPQNPSLETAPVLDTREGGVTPRLTRRNSTASTVSLSGTGEAIEPPPPPPAPIFAKDPVDPAQPQTVVPPQLDAQDAMEFTASPVARRPDISQVRATLERLRDPTTKATLIEWNNALADLLQLRTPHEPVTEIVAAYNDLVARSFKPNARTYATVIESLIQRDEEVHFSIKEMEGHIEHCKAAGASDAPDVFVCQQRIEALRAENNFSSAMSLFQAASTNVKWRFHTSTYTRLLRSCALHQSIESAILVFAHIEHRPDIKASSAVYGQLLSVYVSLGDIEGAKVVFKEYQRICRSHRIAIDNVKAARIAHLVVWNRMVEAYFTAGDTTAALGLLEKMMDSPAGARFHIHEPPTPALSTYKVIIRAFCSSGDVSTAVTWYERLLEQGQKVDEDDDPAVLPPRPDTSMTADLFYALGHANRLEDLNRLFVRASDILADPDRGMLHWVARLPVYLANVRYLRENKLEEAKVLETLDFLIQNVITLPFSVGTILESNAPLAEIVGLYATYNHPDKALRVIQDLGEATGDNWTSCQVGTKDLSQSLLYDNGVARELPLGIVLGLAKVWTERGLHYNEFIADACLLAYTRARETDELATLSAEEWELIALAIVTKDVQATGEYEAFDYHSALLADMAGSGFNPGQLSGFVQDRLVHGILAGRGVEEASAFMATLGPSFMALLENRPEFAPQSLPQPPIDARIDDYHSRYVDEQHIRRGTNIGPLDAFSRFESGVHMGLYPHPDVIGRLIESLGRLKDMGKVDYLYAEAQQAISLLEHDKHAQSVGWAAVENSMIIARGHAGDGQSADVHRVRMLEQGMTPTADAYGALIQCVKETTDDTARAMAYFEEAQMRGVKPNVFLYNTTISKLAKARKADFAIELFQQMKSSSMKPSSITYGAVIAACCRVGDSTSAETLFEEMTSQANFKPRVPPFNTMMQFYVQTKPHRQRFMHYYTRLVQAGIKPTAHTYKLLLDMHGTIEPVDFKSMERTFAQLVNERNVQIQGSHWASLINAYGCVGKDLDKATAIFDSIATHPSTLASGLQLPDAVTFEALINVLVTLRRTDLIPEYLDRLRATGVHMTAYIANLLIRGYAAVGNIEEARRVFDGLVDPPVGVAAPNNHAPHDSSMAPPADPNGLVYREPSTWEAMVRAELGSGNREHAVALLERVLARQYPESIYNRISGIMLDDSVSPWPS
ncbi:hypothetical protein BV25DRAFT_1771569, partial [Artomyces pyxidatus]